MNYSSLNKNHDQHVKEKEETKEDQRDHKKTSHENYEKFAFDLSHNSQEKIPRT